MTTLAEAITLLLALLGTLSQSVRKDQDGQPARTRSGLPVLTYTGWIVVSLLLSAFAVKLWMYKVSSEQRYAEQLAATKQIEDLTDKLKESQAKLEDASVALRRGIKQSNTTIHSFAVSVFFEPVPEGDGLSDSSYNGSLPRSQRLPSAVRESVAKDIFCRPPSSLGDLYVYVPLTSTPPIDLRLGFQDVENGSCTIYASLNTVVTSDTEGSQDKAVDLGHTAFFKNEKRAAFRVLVAEEDLHALGITGGVPLIEFQASRSATITFELAGDSNREASDAMASYVAQSFPSTVGININGSKDLFDEDVDLQATWVFAMEHDPKQAYLHTSKYYLESPRNLNRWRLYEFLFPRD